MVCINYNNQPLCDVLHKNIHSYKFAIGLLLGEIGFCDSWNNPEKYLPKIISIENDIKQYNKLIEIYSTDCQLIANCK
jgi:hypothetical protein